MISASIRHAIAATTGVAVLCGGGVGLAAVADAATHHSAAPTAAAPAPGACAKEYKTAVTSQKARDRASDTVSDDRARVEADQQLISNATSDKDRKKYRAKKARDQKKLDRDIAILQRRQAKYDTDRNAYAACRNRSATPSTTTTTATTTLTAPTSTTTATQTATQTATVTSTATLPGPTTTVVGPTTTATVTQSGQSTTTATVTVSGPTQNTTTTVTATPSGGGTATTTATATQTVTVTTTPTPGALTITPQTRDFGSVPVNGPGRKLIYLVTNNTNQAATVETTANSNSLDFEVADGSDPDLTCDDGALAPGDSCQLPVTFTPTGSGPRSATISVSASAGPIGSIAASATASGTGTFSDS